MYFGVCDLRKLYVRNNHLIKNLKMTSYRRFKPRSFSRPWGYRYTFRFQFSVMWNVWLLGELFKLKFAFPKPENSDWQLSGIIHFFLKERVKFRCGSMVLFFKAFQSHNVLILFWFFIKTSYPLMMKTTPNEIIIVYC